jgi:hypothetical protein
MQNNIFINEAVTKAIEDYLSSKVSPAGEKYNSFLVVIIRALINIYGELDIINPFRTRNETGLGSFEENLKKYGLSIDGIKEFEEEVLAFYHNNTKESFLKIQRCLINMFVLKCSQNNLSEEEINSFKSLLYTRNETNEYKKALYDEFTPDSDEVVLYLDSCLYEQKHNYVFTEYRDLALSVEAYQLAGYNAVDVMRMSDKDLENINNKVYHFFRIRSTDVNKRKRLASAIDYYKKYGNAITSGNGYVDTLLLSSIVATCLMTLIIVAVRLWG